jgi:uncharacterized protein YdiU (UPF0061 family)
MSITGESFDYGPYGFLPSYEPRFIAAYFDYGGRYAFGNQPNACYWNLEMLQVPLAEVIDRSIMTEALDKFKDLYITAYERRMEERLGLAHLTEAELEQIIRATLQLLYATQWGYNEFFAELKEKINSDWQKDSRSILTEKREGLSDNLLSLFEQWQDAYHSFLQRLEYEQITDRLHRWNPSKVPVRPEIERVWAAITEENDWQPFYQLVKEIQA